MVEGSEWRLDLASEGKRKSTEFKWEALRRYLRRLRYVSRAQAARKKPRSPEAQYSLDLKREMAEAGAMLPTMRAERAEARLWPGEGGRGTGFQFADLGAGGGGLTLGFELAGWVPRLLVEKEKKKRQLLAKRFPQAEVQADVRALKVLPLGVRAVLSGFSCKGGSAARARTAEAGRED